MRCSLSSVTGGLVSTGFPVLEQMKHSPFVCCLIMCYVRVCLLQEERGQDGDTTAPPPPPPPLPPMITPLHKSESAKRCNTFLVA